VGYADQEPLIKDDPYDPRNRRISIILLNQTAANVDTPGNIPPTEGVKAEKVASEPAPSPRSR